MLPAHNRMRRSAEFDATVKFGGRGVQPDLIVHLLRGQATNDGPRVGLVISKAVGPAVIRHRVARRVRHVAHALLADLDPTDRLVIRALPRSGNVPSALLKKQLRSGLRRALQPAGSHR